MDGRRGVRSVFARAGLSTRRAGHHRGARIDIGAAARYVRECRRIRESDRDGGQVVTEPLDPITLGVIWGALQSIAVEIGTTVHKTAYSEQAREGQDFSVAVFDARG